MLPGTYGVEALNSTAQDAHSHPAGDGGWIQLIISPCNLKNKVADEGPDSQLALESIIIKISRGRISFATKIGISLKHTKIMAFYTNYGIHQGIKRYLPKTVAFAPITINSSLDRFAFASGSWKVTVTVSSG
jgi:hypothetical protein